MAQILDPLPPNQSDKILCCYVNATSKIQVVRITNIQNWYFERVVFPGQRLIFETLPIAQLEIHCGMMASAILSDTIPCDRLQIEIEAGDMAEMGVIDASSEFKAHDREVLATMASYD
ncbi:MAG: DUF1830 domain-containing protein [Synechococcales cyanobacterium T60_A2020_003]|nr:DUF1830 domain-containing protein [Synechococcales cyanobacterium T60_A2020_003]